MDVLAGAELSTGDRMESWLDSSAEVVVGTKGDDTPEIGALVGSSVVVVGAATGLLFAGTG